MTKKKAQEIWNHLLRTNQWFCFVDGMVVDREYVESILDK